MDVPVKHTSSPATKPSGTSAAAMRRWHPFDGLRDEIDRLFDEFSFGWPRLSSGRALTEPVWRGAATMEVAMEAAEDDKAYIVTAELPGLDEKNVEVKVTDSTITISGENKEEKEEKKKDYYFSERSYGSFQRSFTLPDDVDASKIEASMKKGVLTVTLPKSPEAQKKFRKLDIKAS